MTVGVEEELMILDAETFEPAAASHLLVGGLPAGLLETGLEERPQRPLEVDDPLGVGEGDVALAVDQPADELIALIGDEEEGELQQEVGPTPRQPSPDGG